jgi:hypothetical protein
MSLFPRHPSRKTVLVELMASCALLSACGGGSTDAATDPATAAATDAQILRSHYHPNPTPTPAPTPVVVAPSVLTSTLFTATSADLPNPDRGFYDWSGSDFINAFALGSVQAAYTSGKRLVLALVPLDSYRSTDLPASFLTTLGARFASVRAAGMKTTLLFSYDFTAGGNDATAVQIKRHLEQLKPVLAANADVIPYMRAGFIGAWGEWHSSKSGNSCGYNAGTTPCATADANRIIVRDALLANVPSTTQIGFRYPVDLQQWYPSAVAPARVGAHNDCFLAGPSDTGTYQNTAQRSYVQSLTVNGSFGGETCDAELPVRATCNDVLTEGRQYHLAWLNANGSTTTLNGWKTAGCYSQVSAAMGYRLQLDAISHNTAVARGSSLSFNVDLRNLGWARMFNARQLVVTLQHKTSGATLTAAAGDLSTLPAQASGANRITVTLPIPAGAQVGDYNVLVSVPDIFASTAADPRFSVRFANADNPSVGQAWDATAARFNVGTSVSVN